MRTRVKICGTTNLEDAQLAAQLGVDALGFIFFAKSPRNIDFDDAGAIIRSLPFFIDRVGVFVDASTEEIRRGVQAGLSMLQLHGTESPKYCQELRATFTNCKVIKAFRVGDHTRAADIAPYNDCVDGYLLDTYVAGNVGGTGQVFDWSVIKRLSLKLPFLLAGGLSDDNIVDAVRSVQPYGVDVNSGVELAPGKKDHDAVKKIMAQIASLGVAGE